MTTNDNRRKKSMKSMKDIQITIKGIAGRKGEYVAYYRSEFLDATFSVCFKDNILERLRYRVFRR